MASCFMPKLYYGLETYEKVVSFFLKIDEIGVYNQYGTDKSSATYLILIKLSEKLHKFAP